MMLTTYCARVVRPLPYAVGTGQQAVIPLGPCLVEQHGAHFVDIVWGAYGQEAAVLAFKDLEAAEDRGDLVALD